MSNKIQLLISGDSYLTCTGLRTILSPDNTLDVIGEATKWQEIQYLCSRKQPNIVLVDLHMLDTLKVENPQAQDNYCRWIRLLCGNTKVIILANSINPQQIRELISTGIRGYILKTESAQAIVHAIHSVMYGGTWFSPPIIDILLQSENTPEPLNHWHQLTPMERQLLEMIALGWKNSLIAQELNLAEQTVRNYISRLYVVLKVHSRAEAIIWARENGIGKKQEKIY